MARSGKPSSTRTGAKQNQADNPKNQNVVSGGRPREDKVTISEPRHEHAHQETEVGAEGLARGEQKVTVEDAGPARKALTIEIPADRIKKKIEESYGKLKSDAVLPGFRRGRAPQRLLERRFGTGIRDEVRSQILSESYTQAVEDEKLEVIGEPDVKDFDTIKLPEDGPLTFRVEVEVSPKVELPALDGLEVKKTKKDISDTDVTGEIERLRERYGKMVEANSAEIGAEDFLQADVKIYAGEKADPATAEEIAHQPQTYIQVPGEAREGKGHVAGIIVEKLGDKLEGKKVGDVVTISQDGPETHENDKIKGKPITIVIRIDKVERLEAAELSAILPQLGIETEAELRTKVQQSLESRRDREQQAEMHQQVADHLLEKVTLDLPEGLTGRQAARVLRRQAMEMAYRGVPEKEIEQKVAELRGSSEEDARKQLKLFFILDQAAKTLEVDVTEQEINGRVAMLAMQQGRRPEKLRQQMQRAGELEHLYLQIREQKTLDKVIEKAKVTEVDAPAAPEAEEKAEAGEGKPKKKSSGKKKAKKEGGEE